MGFGGSTWNFWYYKLNFIYVHFSRESFHSSDPILRVYIPNMLRITGLEGEYVVQIFKV